MQVIAMFRGKSAQIQGTVDSRLMILWRPAMTAFPLDPIEKASIDELRALQLKRLKATLAARLRQLAGLQGQVRRGGVHPDGSARP
jgi:hypothetical protein